MEDILDIQRTVWKYSIGKVVLNVSFTYLIAVVMESCVVNWWWKLTNDGRQLVDDDSECTKPEVTHIKCW